VVRQGASRRIVCRSSGGRSDGSPRCPGAHDGCSHAAGGPKPSSVSQPRFAPGLAAPAGAGHSPLPTGHKGEPLPGSRQATHQRGPTRGSCAPRVRVPRPIPHASPATRCAVCIFPHLPAESCQKARRDDPTPRRRRPTLSERVRWPCTCQGVDRWRKLTTRDWTVSGFWVTSIRRAFLDSLLAPLGTPECHSTRTLERRSSFPEAPAPRRFADSHLLPLVSRLAPVSVGSAVSQDPPCRPLAPAPAPVPARHCCLASTSVSKSPI
jgi:hypothetical protein